MPPKSNLANEVAPGIQRGVACDFCTDVVGSVRRVALHGDYERLRTKHTVQYSCPSCFEKKERSRLGLERS